MAGDRIVRPEWPATAARSLVAAVTGLSSDSGAIVAAAAADGTNLAIHAEPEGLAPDAVFEIGSVTKTMTGTLLAMLVIEGRLQLADPIGRWLAAGDNDAITVLQLATHTAGLPRVAQYMAGRPDHANPYRDLTAEVAEDELRRTHLEPGDYDYSNFGYQLLGIVLERASGETYRDLLHDRLFGPLGMACSGVGSDTPGSRLPGRARGGPARRWDQPLPAAGAVETSVGDLGRWAQAQVHSSHPALARAIALATTPQARIDGHRQIGLGWVINHDHSVGHTGETAGFSAALLIDSAAGRAVTVAANTPSRADAMLASAAQTVAGDALTVVEQPALDAKWDERARAVVRSLIAGRAAEVWEFMTPKLRELITVPSLAMSWTVQALGAGEPTGTIVDCWPVGRFVAVDLTVECTRRPMRLALVFGPAFEIVRLATLRAEDGWPW